jgi:Dimerisation domain
MAGAAASPADLVRMVNGMMVSQILHVIATLGVADLLAAGPQTSEDLAPVVHAIPRPLYRLMRAAASLGVLAEDETGAFCLTPLGQYLRTDHPQSVRGWAVFAGTRRSGARGSICVTPSLRVSPNSTICTGCRSGSTSSATPTRALPSTTR